MPIWSAQENCYNSNVYVMAKLQSKKLGGQWGLVEGAIFVWQLDVGVLVLLKISQLG